MDIGSNGLAIVIAVIAVFALAALWRSLVANTATLDTARVTAAAAAVDRAALAAASRPEDLRGLLEAMSRSCAPSLHRGGICLDIRLPSEALIVRVASEDMHALFARIVEHAAGVLGQGATLQVLACAEGAQAVVRWRESNVAEGRPQLAQFFDAKGRSLSASALACERIAHRNGGRIYAAPSSLGGLGLTLRLPLRVDAGSASDAQAGNAPAPAASRVFRSVACAALFSITACQQNGPNADASATASLSTLAPIMTVGPAEAPIAVDHEARRRAVRTSAPQLAASAGNGDGNGVSDASALADN